MFELSRVDLEELAMALADQTDYEHQWLIDPRTGELAFWSSELGIDGHNPVDIDELDLVVVEPVPSYVWYQDMVEFAEGISDSAAGQRLATALQGRGAFRRFKDRLHERSPELVSSWHAFNDVRAQRRGVEWILDEGLIDEDDARTWLAEHPDPELP